MSGKAAGRRGRRAAEQVEMPLPPAPEIVEIQLALHWWQRPAVVAALAALALLAGLLALWLSMASRQDRARAVELDAAVRMLTLRAPTRQRALRIAPNPRSWSAQPDATLAWPEPPEMIDLYLPVGYAAYPAFEITIDKVDVGRLMVLGRVVPDSNRELRLALNSSTFGVGEYRLMLRGYTWRGEHVETGWVRLRIE